MKMKKVFLLFLTGLLLSACTTKEGIEIRGAWMRPTAQGDNGAVYFVLHNYSSKTDELVVASSDSAEAVELHESMIMDGDVMEMNMLTSLPLEASADVEFAPGGLHIMLVGLKEEAKFGDSIEITLHFKNSEDIIVYVPVQESGEGH